MKPNPSRSCKPFFHQIGRCQQRQDRHGHVYRDEAGPDVSFVMPGQESARREFGQYGICWVGSCRVVGGRWWVSSVGYRVWMRNFGMLVPKCIRRSRSDELGMGSLVQVQMNAVLDRCWCSCWFSGGGGAAAVSPVSRLTCPPLKRIWYVPYRYCCLLTLACLRRGMWDCSSDHAAAASICSPSE